MEVQLKEFVNVHPDKLLLQGLQQQVQDKSKTEFLE